MNIILLELTFDMVIILLLVKFTFLITESQCILHLLSIKQIQISPNFPYWNSLEKTTSIWFQFCNIIDLYLMKILSRKNASCVAQPPSTHQYCFLLLKLDNWDVCSILKSIPHCSLLLFLNSLLKLCASFVCPDEQ